MLGLRYILLMTETKATDLSTSIGISNQFINDWVKGRKPIPDKHLAKLSNYFKLEESYFKKQLTLREKLEIDLTLHSFNKDISSEKIREIQKILNQ